MEKGGTVEPLQIIEPDRPLVSREQAEEDLDDTEDDRDLTLESPLLPALAPAPAASPALIAAMAAAGSHVLSLLSEPLAESHALALLCALCALGLGASLGRLFGRYPSGGLLAAASWVIGGYGVGVIVSPTASPITSAPPILWIDAGLIGIVAGAAIARGPAEHARALWVAPARIVALFGASHAAIWIPIWCWLAATRGQPTPLDHLALLPCAAALVLASALTVRTGPSRRPSRAVAALFALPAAVLAWPHPTVMFTAALSTPEGYPMLVLPVVSLASALAAAVVRDR